VVTPVGLATLIKTYLVNVGEGGIICDCEERALKAPCSTESGIKVSSPRYCK